MGAQTFSPIFSRRVHHRRVATGGSRSRLGRSSRALGQVDDLLAVLVSTAAAADAVVLLLAVHVAVLYPTTPSLSPGIRGRVHKH